MAHQSSIHMHILNIFGVELRQDQMAASDQLLRLFQKDFSFNL